LEGTSVHTCSSKKALFAREVGKEHLANNSLIVGRILYNHHHHKSTSVLIYLQHAQNTRRTSIACSRDVIGMGLGMGWGWDGAWGLVIPVNEGIRGSQILPVSGLARVR
jgi:hypothetical protein